jgi:NAD-dependent deacetylase sirtuin 5
MCCDGLNDVISVLFQVYPAASIAAQVQGYGGKVAVFNLNPSEGDKQADFLVRGPSEQTLPPALGLEEHVADLCRRIESSS